MAASKLAIASVMSTERGQRIAAIEQGLEEVGLHPQRVVEASDCIIEMPNRMEREATIDPWLGAPWIGGQRAVMDGQSLPRLSAFDQQPRRLRVGVEQVRLVSERAFEAAQCFLVLSALLQRGAEQIVSERVCGCEFHSFAQQLLRLGDLALLGHDEGEQEHRIDIARLAPHHLRIAQRGVGQCALTMQQQGLLHQWCRGGLRHALTPLSTGEREPAAEGSLY